MIERLLQKIKWNSGRQRSGYKTIKLFESKKLLCDAYLIYYPKGSAIASHFDKVIFGNHYRLNLTLKKAKKGGIFILAGKPVFKLGTIAVIFRPDKQCHSVSTIQEGYRVVFSFGWVKKKKHGQNI